MLKTLVLTVAFGLSGAAIAQQPQPSPAAKPDAKAESAATPESSAAGGASRPRCDFMSAQQSLRQVGADIIESCLKQPQPAASDATNEVKDPKQQPR